MQSALSVLHTVCHMHITCTSHAHHVACHALPLQHQPQRGETPQQQKGCTALHRLAHPRYSCHPTQMHHDLMSCSIATLPAFITIFDMQALCAEVFPSMHTCAVDTDTQIKLYALRLLQSLILEPENPSVAHRALEVVSTYSGPTAITHGAWCDLRMHVPV